MKIAIKELVWDKKIYPRPDSYLVLLGGDGVFRISKAVDFREVLQGVLA